MTKIILPIDLLHGISASRWLKMNAKKKLTV